MKKIVTDIQSLDRAVLDIVDYGTKLFESLQDSDDCYVLSLEKLKKNRTNQQNKLYWMWMSVICETTGNDKNDMSEICKRMFLQWRTVDVFGERSMIVPQSKDLSTTEFSTFLDNIAQWASEHEICLPYPEDLGYNEMYAKYGQNSI